VFYFTGRIFEAPAMKMLKSLDMVSRLKSDTLVWPGMSLTFINNIVNLCHRRWVRGNVVVFKCECNYNKQVTHSKYIYW